VFVQGQGLVCPSGRREARELREVMVDGSGLVVEGRQRGTKYGPDLERRKLEG